MTAAPPTKVEIASAALMQFLVNNMTPDGEPPDEWLVDILVAESVQPRFRRLYNDLFDALEAKGMLDTKVRPRIP